MKKFTCNLCGEVLSTYRGRFKKHIEEIHNFNFEDYLRKYHPELGGYCGVCGKPTRLNNLNKGFHQFCSKKCCSIGTVEQRKQTWLEKYGVEHPFQSLEIRNKIKQTMLEKYGVEHPLQNKDIQNKHKQTMLEKYGVENPVLSPEIQEKMKNTCLEKYGVEHVLQSPEIKEKMKQTMIEKYGVEHALQNDIFKEKSKQTCKEHYGVEYSSQSPEVQEKMKQTMIEKYGVEYSSQSPIIQEKIKQTMIEKYGVENPGQSPEIQEKMKQTCLEKYGVENPSQAPEIKEKKKQTSLKHYGVEHTLQSPEIRNRIKQTNLEKYGVEYLSQSPEIQEKQKKSSILFYFNKHEEVCKRLDIIILESPEEWYHKEFDLDIHTHRFHCNIHNIDFEAEWFADRNLCPKCLTAHYSRGEREVGDYIESLGISIERNDRNQIGPKEIDIWIPSKNIGIEYNGSYWHQDQSKDQEKKLLCESKGITLFFIWDTEWENNKEEVKEYLRRLLNQ